LTASAKKETSLAHLETGERGGALGVFFRLSGIPLSFGNEKGGALGRGQKPDASGSRGIRLLRSHQGEEREKERLLSAVGHRKEREGSDLAPASSEGGGHGVLPGEKEREDMWLAVEATEIR